MRAPYRGRAHDSRRGSGGLFAESEKSIEIHYETLLRKSTKAASHLVAVTV